MTPEDPTRPGASVEWNPAIIQSFFCGNYNMYKPSMVKSAPFAGMVKIYPNPANEYINVSLGDVEKNRQIRVELVDVVGRV